MNLVMALVPAAALAAGNYLVAVQPGCIACTAWLVAGPFVLALLLVAVLPRMPARETVAPVVAAPPAATAEDGALGLLAALQATGRLVDFLEEDLAPYGDDQIGAGACSASGWRSSPCSRAPRVTRSRSTRASIPARSG